MIQDYVAGYDGVFMVEAFMQRVQSDTNNNSTHFRIKVWNPKDGKNTFGDVQSVNQSAGYGFKNVSLIDEFTQKKGYTYRIIIQYYAYEPFNFSNDTHGYQARSIVTTY
jgi:hypothetical protein